MDGAKGVAKGFNLQLLLQQAREVPKPHLEITASLDA